MSVSKAPATEKGARYIGRLDQALCNGNWGEVPELARKVDKHAPGRKSLTLAAQSEAQIDAALRRSTSVSSVADSSLRDLDQAGSKLKDTISSDDRIADDTYAARVCLAEIQWLQGDWAAALEALQDTGMPSKLGSSSTSALGWLEVCTVKAVFIRAAISEEQDDGERIRNLYLTAVAQTLGSRSAELRKWTERLLARSCMYFFRKTTQPSVRMLSECLRCFMAWSDFWQRTSPSQPEISTMIKRIDVPRRQVWKAYYDLLSMILQNGLMYNPFPSSSSDLLVISSSGVSDDTYTRLKLRQHTGLKSVEATYEALLVNEAKFPHASQSNVEVEQWVDQVVCNWKAFRGNEWTEIDLGDRDTEGLNRGVLDILYRAATKTFHSTAILRQLFVVHAALGEFDLAINAFNSYVEIVSQGRARAAKTGKPQLGIDSDDTAIQIAAMAVRILCKYGDRDQAEKALDIGENIKTWLGQYSSDTLRTNERDPNDCAANEEARPSTSQSTEARLQPESLAAAYRAIGIARANWARLTYESDSRAQLQAEALQYLKRAQSHSEGIIETTIAQALVLAETGNVQAATHVIKDTIASVESEQDDDDETPSDYSRERQLVSLWHLLALCLTAKDDYEQAAKMCDAAFEQFGDSNVLFGENSHRLSNDTEKASPAFSRGVIDQMESLEKEGIIQIKMSKLALIELMEGAEAAIERSHELLSLYARLFGQMEAPQTPLKPPPTSASATPSKVGTLRGIATSMRPKSARNSVEKDARKVATASGLPPQPISGPDSRSETGNDQPLGPPISITVTSEDGKPTERPPHHKHLPFKLRGTAGDWRQLSSFQSKSSENLKEKPGMDTGITPVPPLPRPADSAANASGMMQSAVATSQSLEKTTNSAQPLKEMAHNAPHDAWPPPLGHPNQPPYQDVRLPAPHPASSWMLEPRFPSTQDKQQNVSLLVNVWLFIAGLYLRAGMLYDVAGALEEASKLVSSLEVSVGAEHSQAKRFFDKGWGGGKSVDELWADVWSARGGLASASERPFEAMSHYERALSYSPDHSEGIIGVSNILMDIYEEKIPAEEPKPALQPFPSASASLVNNAVPPPTRRASVSNKPSTPKDDAASTHADKTRRKDPTPAELNRLAARDRAYMLLSNLTRLGSGWDNSEAWLSLARAHELSKQIGKAKQALWWVVELEENKPIREWSVASAGRFTL